MTKLKLFLCELLVFVNLIIFCEAAPPPKNYNLRKSGGTIEPLLAFYIIIGVLGGLLGFVVAVSCCLRCRDSCKQPVVSNENQDQNEVST